MRFTETFYPRLPCARLLATAVCFLPGMILAHPGHYHPDETDEFELARSLFLHSHGRMDYVLGFVAVAGVVVACTCGRPGVRIGAMVMALGSLVTVSLLP